MFVLMLSGLIALLFLLVGLLSWLGLRLFRVRRKGLKVLKVTAIGYLLFLPFFLFCLFPILVSYLIADSGTRPMDQSLKVDPKTYGCDFQEVSFQSRDGLRLSGWWMKGEETLPSFLLAHGLFRDRKEVVERACRFNQLGYGALAFDLRRHGKSDQRGRISMGYLERLDVLGAEEFVRRRSPAGVVAFGVSMGAAATLEASPDFGPEVRAIVADSPFQSLTETVRRHVKLVLGLPSFPFSEVFTWNLTRICGFREAEFDVTRAIHSERPIPTLLIYGEKDVRMPAETARAVFDAIPHARKKLVFFKDARHGAAWRRDPQRYISTVVEFLQESGGEASTSSRTP